MFLLLTILFLVVPIVELYVIVQVAGGIGTLETIGLLILVSLLGAWLVRREGMGVMRKVQTQLGEGKMPTAQLVDGALILFAGALMLTPGFVTDSFGVFLLLPPTRILVRKALMAQFKGRVQVGTMGPNMRFGGPIFDVNSTEQTTPDHVDLTRDNDDTEPPSLPR
jgi:UPF0716 protein FxsA